MKLFKKNYGDLIFEAAKEAGDLTISVGLLGLGLFVIIESLRMPSGFFNTPGPGVYPRLLGGMLCIVSLILGFRCFSRQKEEERVQLGHANIWTALLAVILAGALLERIGFILTFTFFLAFLFKKLSDHGWIWCALLAFLGASSAFLFFDTLLGLRLPPLYILR